MAFKSILTIATEAKTLSVRAQSAAALASEGDAHFDVLGLSVDSVSSGYSYIGAGVEALHIVQKHLNESAKHLDIQLRHEIARQRLGLYTAVETATVQMTAIRDLVAQRARYADVVVLPRPYGKGRGHVSEIILEAALFEGRAPVLILPDDTSSSADTHPEPACEHPRDQSPEPADGASGTSCRAPRHDDTCAPPRDQATVLAAAGLPMGAAPPSPALPPLWPLLHSLRRVVIAWNASPEALGAIRAALPLLQRAERVIITMIDPSQRGADRSDPGGALCQMLARHGIKAEVAVRARGQGRVADVLAHQLRELDADLLVMGAYGHSRFREAIMGGATRQMLETAQVPVLMAH